MQHCRLFATAAAIVALGTTSPLAQGKSGSAPKGGAPKTTTAALPGAGGGNAGGPKGNGSGAGQAKGAVPVAPGGPKSSTPAAGASASGTTAPSGPGMGGGKKAAALTASSTGTASGSTTTTGTTAGATTTTVPMLANPVSTKITRNPQQLARVRAMLPDGMTLEQASAGFRNQGQFLAALNVSKNRGISFVDLQQAMTVEGLSLGQAARQIQMAPVTPAPAPATGTPTGTATGTTGTATGATGTGTTSTTTTSTTTTTAPATASTQPKS